MWGLRALHLSECIYHRSLQVFVGGLNEIGESARTKKPGRRIEPGEYFCSLGVCYPAPCLLKLFGLRERTLISGRRLLN